MIFESPHHRRGGFEVILKSPQNHRCSFLVISPFFHMELNDRPSYATPWSFRRVFYYQLTYISDFTDLTSLEINHIKTISTPPIFQGLPHCPIVIINLFKQSISSKPTVLFMFYRSAGTANDHTISKY